MAAQLQMHIRRDAWPAETYFEREMKKMYQNCARFVIQASPHGCYPSLCWD